ncbi:MAG: hypothetical protein ACN4GM_08215 [Gammaproteobacteria bacterium]
MGVKKEPLTPSDLAGNGILVAKIDSNGRFKTTGDAYINGEKYSDALLHGDLVISLKPGSYTLETIGYSYQTSTSNKSEGYPVNLSFTIKQGRVTNLGQIFAYYKSFSDKQYKLYTIDNSPQAAEYLKQEQPAIYLLVRKNKIMLAKGKYLSKGDTNKLRKLIAYSSAIETLSKDVRIVYGELGTVASVIRNKNNQIKDFKLIETGTLDEISYCSENSVNYACVVPNGINRKILAGKIGGKYKLTDMPGELNNVKIQLSGKNDIVLVDNYLKLYESNNDGKTFSVNTEFTRTEPVQNMGWINFYNSKKGFYLTVFSHSKSENLIIFKPQSTKASFISIPLPKEVGRVRELNETKNNLIMGAYPGSFSSSEVYYLKHGSNNWKEVTVPTRSCNKIDVLNYAAGKLKMKCGYSQTLQNYISNDSGASWNVISGVR